jgi:MinD-like ATPase involved in chromosome partitioning or flagellar assembly
MGERVARAVHERLAPLAQRFLEVPLPLMGHIAMDAAVCAAVMRRVPVVVSSPHTSASEGLQALAARLTDARYRDMPRPSLSFFLKSSHDPGGIVDPSNDRGHIGLGARERHGINEQC